MAACAWEGQVCVCSIGYVTLLQPSVPCESIKHTVIWVEENSKRKKLMALLSDPKHFQWACAMSHGYHMTLLIHSRPPAVVFVSSKMGALLLAEAINKVHGLTHIASVEFKSQFVFFVCFLTPQIGKLIDASPSLGCWYPWRHGSGASEWDSEGMPGGQVLSGGGHQRAGPRTRPGDRETGESSSSHILYCMYSAMVSRYCMCTKRGKIQHKIITWL